MNYEKLGAFYLGRPYDLASEATRKVPLLYDSKDLTTHAVCVGMTGSGKTGLCVSLLEEAAMDGIPALAIDPKGDLGNLLLTFPDLKPGDFAPWVNEDDARRKGLSVEDYAAEQATLWRDGLASWGQDGDRIRRLRDAADFAIFTPGSEAGLPVSILSSFAAPPEAVRSDGDLLRERVASTTTSLLGLMGVDADPIRSREHILIATLLDHHWRAGGDLDLASLIGTIQAPPVSRIGVLELESFYPAKDRFELSMRLNNLLAAPGFQGWMSGHPLDVQRLLYTSSGKPRIAIFSIAHLSESERMFFVSLLLNQTLGWMRTRPGTTSLRALLYMDEIFGYAPPSAEPPSKKPLLTMLKQARAYGLGVVLATQNPVDLDYKGLSNTGTWFLGRLQTERDKMRVLEGLEGVAAGSKGGFDRGGMEEILAGLGKRVFLMHNVHESEPVVFQTRWAMSYLRGPLTREQVKRLMQDRPRAEPPPEERAVAAPQAPPVAGRAPVAAAARPAGRARPVLAPGVPQVFLPLRRPADKGLHYRPQLLGVGQVVYVDRGTKKKLSAEDVALLLSWGEGAIDPDWDSGRAIDLDPADLEKAPQEGATFGELPPETERAGQYKGWEKDFADALYRNRHLELFRSPSLGLISEPGESESDFRVRLAELGREKRDALAEKLRDKYAKKVARLEERIRKSTMALEREKEQVSHQSVQTAISLGTTLLSAFLGRKAFSRSTLGRATTTARGIGRRSREKQDVERARRDLAAQKEQLDDLNRELESELDELEDRTDALSEKLETIALRPRKSDVKVRLVSLAWSPCAADGTLEPLWE